MREPRCMIVAWLAPDVRADGDPASDILTTQALFLPQDAGVPAAQQAQLVELLQAARRSGYPIRVALVASRGDLGSITELWQKPQSYAQFLGQELALVDRGPLLVIMPVGFGVYQVNRTPARPRAVLDALAPPRTATALEPQRSRPSPGSRPTPATRCRHRPRRPQPARAVRRTSSHGSCSCSAAC
ncbi:MAG TPA: hypothetical protein VMU39_11670 [Solirubrobacteraceae bacterium]|nr:hypothetical protein [Solirubrobacteraceae bacterium]